MFNLGPILIYRQKANFHSQVIWHNIKEVAVNGNDVASVEVSENVV